MFFYLCAQSFQLFFHLLRSSSLHFYLRFLLRCFGTQLPLILAQQLYKVDRLQKDHYGIWEPVNKKVVLPVDIDFILVPGVAFDKKYHRLGYGGGYYDLFLSQTRKETQKIGLAYAMQITEELPVRCEDIAMDGVITEDGLL